MIEGKFRCFHIRADRYAGGTRERVDLSGVDHEADIVISSDGFSGDLFEPGTVYHIVITKYEEHKAD